MSDFGTPGSPNAAALQNILGASNILRVPQSENEELLQLIAQQTQTLINTINEVKNTVDILSSIQRYIGVTTTEITDGDSTNPVIIDGASVTAVNGDAVLYNGEDFVYNGEIWQSVPDALGALAYKSSASGSYTPQGIVSQPIFTGTQASVSVTGTPQGTVSQPTFTGTQASVSVTGTPQGTVSTPTATVTPTTATIGQITAVGTLPTMTYDSSTETLTFAAGTLPTAADVTVMTGASVEVSQPTFTGETLTSSGNFTPQGAVSQPTFTGETLTSSGNFTPQGTVSQPTFTGTAATITVE